MSKEWRDKISAIKKEYFKTHDGWWKGRKRSVEQCQGMGERMKGKWAGNKNPRHNNPLTGAANGVGKVVLIKHTVNFVQTQKIGLMIQWNFAIINV